MKPIYFLKDSHNSDAEWIIISYIVTVPLFVLIAEASKNFILCLLTLVILNVLFSLWLIKYLGEFGLYISEKEIYYKAIKTQNINLLDIAGIKIIPAQIPTRNILCPLKGKYSAILLNSITDEMCVSPNTTWFNQGDMRFKQYFKEFIICSAVYEKEAIDYLLKLNPDIQIIK